jgi:hypothetical protein
MKKKSITEDKEQNEKATKRNNNGKHQPPVATPATDNKKNLAKDTNGLNQANTINNNLEPGDKRK